MYSYICLFVFVYVYKQPHGNELAVLSLSELPK